MHNLEIFGRKYYGLICKYFYLLSEKYTLFYRISQVGVRLFLMELFIATYRSKMMCIHQAHLQTSIHSLFIYPFNE